jgi:hypothetical protein
MKLKKLMEGKSAAFQIKMNSSWKDTTFPVKDLDELAYVLSDKPSSKLVDQSWFCEWFKKEFVGPSPDTRLDWNDIDIIKHEDDVLKVKLRFTVMSKDSKGNWRDDHDEKTQELTIMPAD